MALLSETVKWRDLSGGVISSVSSDIAIQNSVPFTMNFSFDEEIGLVLSRRGTNIIGSQLSAGNTCRGLYNFRDSVGSNSALLSVFNGLIYNTVSGATLSSGLTASSKMEFVTFLNNVLAVNGTEPARYWDGSGLFSTSGGYLDTGNVPSGSKYLLEFHDRLYVAGSSTYPDKLSYTTTPSSGTVSWTTSGSGNIQIEREDGGGTITALSKVPGYVLIFKERSLKRWNTQSTFPDDLVTIGTQSQKSVVTANGTSYFFYGPRGFYATRGDYPTLISKPVQRIVDAITSSYYSNVSGGTDNRYIYWSIGDITVTFINGYTETHNNVVLRYTIDTQEWTVLKYVHEFRSFSQYVSGTDVLLSAGDMDGQVLQLNTGSSDYNGNAIFLTLNSHELDFGRRHILKTIQHRIIVHTINGEGCSLQVRKDGEQWETVGNIHGNVTEIQISPFTAHVFEFRILGQTLNSRVIFRGLDFPVGSVDILESV